jgi:tetratricopeptide (TPR) repeat protein
VAPHAKNILRAEPEHALRDGMSKIRVLIFLSLLLRQGMAMDETQVRYSETMELASTEGIPAVIRKLDNLAGNALSSPFTPTIHETILAIGLLHPGSVPDWSARITSLKASSSGNPLMAKALKRLDILQSYYAAALEGHPENASSALSDPVFEGSSYGIQAQADAALRARDYDKAVMLALQVIENDPHSPLLSNAFMILGLSSSNQGDSKSALAHFQHALAVSELPMIYGNPRDYVYTAYRFSRAAPAAVGDIFDETISVRMTEVLKDPQTMIFGDKGFVLLDKELLLTVLSDGKVVDKKPMPKIVDVTVAGSGKIYALAQDRIDFGGGNAVTLSMNAGKKVKRITSLSSVAVGIGGDVYFLDDNAGLLRATSAAASGNLTLTVLAPAKGRLVRTDRHGNIYILEKDKKSIQIFSRDGKQLAGISADPVAGKTESIEYFAFDSLNHIYILASNSIQIFALKNVNAGFEKKKVGHFAFDQRPQLKNLKVLAVNPSGELVVTGKNENNWVCFK